MLNEYMNKKQQKKIKNQRGRRAGRVRKKIVGTSIRPRLAVYRSLTSLSAQVIDDSQGFTLSSVHQRDLKKSAKGGAAAKKTKSMDVAKRLGKLIAEKSKKAGIEEVVFDRRHYRYHGRVKAFAEAAREAGLKF